ncbi:MAG TPA: endonuclease III [Bacteroidales bacterium]|nr:endonuclease III [Bacteroidales bacterium]
MRNWEKDLEPLLNKYGKRKHPLEYKNRYQLMVMIVLSAQTTDNLINKIAPEFFKVFPSMSELKLHQPEDLYPYISKATGFRKKAKWLIEIANITGNDEGIPHTIEELTKLPGFGRKSSNVLIRESGDTAGGVMVDLHVARVAPRLGVATSDKPDKIEKEIMAAFPREKWNDIGMSLSYHGREICRPKPDCGNCIVNSVCDYFKSVVLKQAVNETNA